MNIANQSLCDDSRFKEVYNMYAQDLHDFIYYKYGSEFNPDDIVQESFIKLWKNCGNVTIQKVKSYLFTLANNATLNVIKHKKVVLKYQKQEVPQSTIETPEFILEQEQFMEKYEKALANLSAEQRIAFLLNKAKEKNIKKSQTNWE
ncbi:MAG: RNA polymerase sigma factor [Patiriisocius sp.]|uniref:RNA polymerase sigma factor n=1 Tax=Patiriisocius sp. TaxID=2822396 RepID=UPI003EF42665